MATISRQMTGSSNAPTLQLIVTEKSKNIDSNSTVLDYVFSISRPSPISSSASKSYTININGQNISGTTTVGGSGTKTIHSGSVTVPHNSDGSKTINFSFSINMGINWNGVYNGTVSQSGSMTLTTIPRATKPTLSASSVTLGNSVTINLPRASSNFTHEVKVILGSFSQNLSANATTSLTFTPSLNDFANKITTSTSATATIQVVTKNGSATIGSSSISIRLDIPTNIVPTADHTLTAISKISGIYIAGYSQVKVTNSGTGAYGSTITNYSTVIKRRTQQIQSNSSREFTSNKLNNFGTYTIQTTVTDSRGRTNTKSTNISVSEYTTPTISNVTNYRSNSAGVSQSDGAYGNLGATVFIDNSITGNTGTFKIEYKETSSSTWIQALSVSNITGNSTRRSIKELNTEREYNVKLTLTDKITHTIYESVIASADVVLDLHHSGHGMGIGKSSTKEYLIDISDDWKILGGRCEPLGQNDNLNNQIYQGTYINNYNAHGTSENNYPIQEAGFLEVFINDKNRGMIFQRYTSYLSHKVFVRVKYSESWQQWEEIIAQKVQQGYNSASITSKNNLTIKVNFTKPFKNVPSVVATINSGAPQLYSVSVNGITRESFNLTLYNGHSATINVGAYWIATEL